MGMQWGYTPHLTSRRIGNGNIFHVLAVNGYVTGICSTSDHSKEMTWEYTPQLTNKRASNGNILHD
jgi:hypothetical protein